MNWPLVRHEVAEHSMLPTLRPGDWILTRRTRRIRPGQVVLAWHPARDGLLLVKRATRKVEGGWWLESDFPEAPGAQDSGAFGPVPRERIVGRVLACYWPRFKSRFLPAGTGRNQAAPRLVVRRGAAMAGELGAGELGRVPRRR